MRSDTGTNGRDCSQRTWLVCVTKRQIQCSKGLPHICFPNGPVASPDNEQACNSKYERMEWETWYLHIGLICYPVAKFMLGAEVVSFSLSYCACLHFYNRVPTSLCLSLFSCLPPTSIFSEKLYTFYSDSKRNGNFEGKQ